MKKNKQYDNKYMLRLKKVYVKDPAIIQVVSLPVKFKKIMKEETNKEKQVLFEVKHLQKEGWKSNYYSTETREKRFVTGCISGSIEDFIERWQEKLKSKGKVAKYI